MPSGGFFNIAGYLRLEGVDGIKALLLAETGEEVDNDGFVVKGGETLNA